MPSLSLQKWVPFVPSIPGNWGLPEGERFFVELRAGATMVEWDAMLEALQKPTDDATRVEVLRPFVRLGPVPLSLDGAKVESLDTLLAAFLGQTGFPLWRELVDRLLYVNRVEGAREVFCGPPSGGASGTPVPSFGKGASATAAR